MRLEEVIFLFDSKHFETWMFSFTFTTLQNCLLQYPKCWMVRNEMPGKEKFPSLNHNLCTVQNIFLEVVETPFEIFWEILHIIIMSQPPQSCEILKEARMSKEEGRETIQKETYEGLSIINLETKTSTNKHNNTKNYVNTLLRLMMNSAQYLKIHK